MLVIAALMTSFYSWRLIFMTFYGEERGDKHTHEHAHESPMVMLVPLGVLALGSIFAGMIWFNSFFGSTEQVSKFYGIPTEIHAAEEHGGDHAEDDHGDDHAKEDSHGDDKYSGHAKTFAGAPGQGALYMGPENTVLDDAHHVPKWVKASPFAAMLIGFILAWVMYIRSPDLPRRIAEVNWPLYQFLKNKWYFDEVYDVIFVKPAMFIGRFFWKRGDGTVIDGGLNGVAMGIIPFFTRLAGRAQSGYIFTYAFWMVIGIAALLTWMTLGGGAN
jgi:NADH-quinone oxidoreductase subunit L